MSNLQSSTIRTPKNVLDSIKIYCKKKGKNIGDWVETAYSFIIKNGFDIYDEEATPYLPVKEEEQIQTNNKIEALCKMMGSFIAAQQNRLPEQKLDLTKLTEMAIELGTAKADKKALEMIIYKKEQEIEKLKEINNIAIQELKRIEREQKTIGKIKINIPG